MRHPPVEAKSRSGPQKGTETGKGRELISHLYRQLQFQYFGTFGSLDRCGVKACFCLNGILKDARREEIQKRGHRILEGDYPRKNQAVVCSSYEIANRPESVFRQVFSEITQQRKTEIVIQDIWRNDNTLVEGIVLEGLQKGYSFELVSRDFCLVEP